MIPDRSIVIEWYQYNIRKKITKSSSTDEVMERMETNTPINLVKGHKIFIFNKSSTLIRTISKNSTTVIKPLANIIGGEIETSFFVASYFIMEPITLASFRILTVISTSHYNMICFWKI